MSSLVPGPVTLFFISSPRARAGTLSPWPGPRPPAAGPINDIRRSFDGHRRIAYSNLFTLFYVSSLSCRRGAAESFKLSLPRRDTDNSNHAVTDEGGGAAAATTRVMAAIP